MQIFPQDMLRRYSCFQLISIPLLLLQLSTYTEFLNSYFLTAYYVLLNITFMVAPILIFTLRAPA